MFSDAPKISYDPHMYCNDAGHRSFPTTFTTSNSLAL